MPMTAKAMEALASAGVPAKLFAEVQPNPVEANLAAGVAAFKAGGHDGVVAFGGGSALDAGKLIAFMHGQTVPVFDFEDVGDWWTRADASAIAPVVAVPTTAGTGSEVGRAAVVTNEKTHTKKIIFHPQMLPEGDDLRSGADRRHAAGDHGRHRHGRVRTCARSAVRAQLSRARRRHRGRRRAAGEGEPRRGIQGRHQHRGARPHDGGRRGRARPRSRRGSARSMRSRIRSARSTTRITG